MIYYLHNVGNYNNTLSNNCTTPCHEYIHIYVFENNNLAFLQEDNNFVSGEERFNTVGHEG